MLARERLIAYDPKARRVYVLCRRLHHGAAGLALCGAGVVLMVHDRRDWPWKMARELLK